MGGGDVVVLEKVVASAGEDSPQKAELDALKREMEKSNFVGKDSATRKTPSPSKAKRQITKSTKALEMEAGSAAVSPTATSPEAADASASPKAGKANPPKRSASGRKLKPKRASFDEIEITVSERVRGKRSECSAKVKREAVEDVDTGPTKREKTEHELPANIDQFEIPPKPVMPDLPLLWGRISRFSKDTVEVGKECLGLQKHVLYSAKIVAVDKEKRKKAKLHYQGWNAKYDEWFDYDGIIIANRAGLQLMAALIVARDFDKNMAAHEKAVLKAQRDAQTRTAGKRRRAEGGQEARTEGKRTRRSVTVEEEEEEEEEVPLIVPPHVQSEEDHYHGKPEVLIRVNDELKVKLVEDWACVTQKKMLVKLPRTPTVASVLQDYAEQASQKGWCSAPIATQLIERLKVYFRLDLPRKLLYPQERKQYKELAASSDLDVCDVYGPEHLLRMFTTLPAALAQTSLGRRHMEVNVKCLQDVLKFLSTNSAQLFPAEAFGASTRGGQVVI
eukprot:m.70668 g.70668  ORF g.70668 m.70668 type:complete len:504 (+) comp10027_c0_seq1:135-1646(+)